MSSPNQSNGSITILVGMASLLQIEVPSSSQARCLRLVSDMQRLKVYECSRRQGSELTFRDLLVLLGTNMEESFGPYLKRCRNEAGISLRALGHFAKMSHSAIA